MAARPLTLRERRVRDLAHELGLEVVLVAVELEDVASLELAQHRRVAAREQQRGRGGAVRADDREVLDDAAHLDGQCVESRRDQTVQCRRQRAEPFGAAVVRAVGLAHQCDELLDEEGVAAAAFLEERGHALVERPAVELTCQLRGRVGVERIEVQHGDVVMPGRRRPALLEIGARRREQHERKRAEPAQEPRERAEHEIVGPVDVGEHQDERPLLRGTLRTSPSRHGSRRRARSAGVDAGLGDAVGHVEHAVDDAIELRGRLADAGDLLHRGAQLVAPSVQRLLVVEPAERAERLGDRRPHVRLAVRRAAPDHDPRTVLLLHLDGHLVRDAGLADAGVAEHEHEVRAPARGRHLVCVAQRAHLGIAADE